MIYLDNAATTGTKPANVVNAVVLGLKKYSANPGRGGHKASIEAATRIYEIRKKVGDYFGADDVNSICFTNGCTASINTVINGCLEAGDHIIISSLEHNALLRPLVSLSEKKNIEIDILEIDINYPEKAIENLKRMFKKNTKMLFVNHSSNVFGTVLPIKEFGRICKEQGVLFAVDAAQSAGHVKIDVNEMNIDYLCIAPHKGLYAPMGCGILIVRKPIEDVLIKGGTGINSISPYQPTEFPERIESGTLNLPAIFGIGAGIDFISSKNYQNQKSKEKYLLHILYRFLKQNDAVLYTDDPLKSLCVPLISFNFKNKSSEELAAYLSAHDIAVRGGLHCAPLAHKYNGTIETGTVRVSTSIFNTEQDIEKLIFSLKKI
ncbi:MAG: aminotransferase class V-fold PLP-dependent enzyme [Clostridia bacterium]|nr:aminotransferase class V-fold PLP-dependent enzyme [Clostridia bacterium]